MAVSPQPALYPTGNDAATSAAIALLIHYFDLAPASAQLLVKKWLTNYPAIWVRAAVTEALYQGRYKPFSVEQILAFWQRRGKSIPHFNKEFETIIAVPLQGSFKTETDVAIEGNGELESGGVASAVTEAGEISVMAVETALAPSTTLAEALEAAEQEQSDTDTPLPRPRLMLPGELPGKGLAQRSSAAQGSSIQGSAVQDHAPEISTTSTQRSASEPQLPGASALSQPQGFDGVLDPRPRPQITQGPDSALVAETKSKQIQPPPIGRFTPAADPSGFASRLKTVVEQAIAKTQTKEEQLSLETAIASQLASDPVLGQPRGEEASAEPESDESSALRVEAIAETEASPTQLPEAAEFEETAEVEKLVELEADIGVEATAELEATPPSVASADVEVPTLLNLEVQTVEEEAQQAADIAVRESDPWEAGGITEAEATEADVISEPEVLSPEPAVRLNEEAIASLLASQEQSLEPDLLEAAEEASALNEPAADSPAPSQAEMVDAIAEEPGIPSESSEESVAAPPELTAPFEERFPLTNANGPQALSSPTRDAIDIELDNRLIETRMDEEPQISLTPADNDRLDLVFESEPESKQEPRSRLEEAIEADEADLLALGGESQLLNDDALTRHLEAGFKDESSDESRLDAASDVIAANVTGTDGASIAAADFPAKDFPANTDALLEAADPSAAKAVTPEGESLELGSELGSTSPLPGEVPQPTTAAEPLPENAQEISQVSNLMAGLTQLHHANSYPESLLPGIGAMQPEQLGEDSNEADSDADNGQSET